MDAKRKEHLREAIETSLGYSANEVSSDTILEGIDSKLYQAWLIGDVYIITSVVIYESIKRLRVCCCSGKFTKETSLEALSVLESFAKKAGCVGIEILGRKGWERALQKHGYKTQYTVLIKEV